MNIVRPMLSIGANMMQNYAIERIENRYKKYAFLISLVCMAPTLWSYVNGDEIMADINMISLMLIVFSLIGSFLGPMMLESKAKAMGNTVDKLDFFGMLIGMGLGAFFAYLVVFLHGGALIAQIGDFSYPVMALLVSIPLSMFITLLAQAFMGKSWAVNILDRNKSGDLDVGDITKGASEIASLITGGASAVKEATDVVSDAIDEVKK